VGHVLNVINIDVTKASKKKAGWYSRLRLPNNVVQEVSLVFFTWLLLMPTSMTGDEVAKNVEVALSIIKPPPSRLSAAADLKRPMDIMFSMLSPLALTAMNSSAFLTKMDNKSQPSFFASLIGKLETFFDIAVYTRLISKNTKKWLTNTIIESSALTPAAMTLLMPSYFTSFGVIYVSLVVPSGYSANSCKAIREPSSKLDKLMLKMEDASRYLKFWTIHAVMSLILASLAPLLAWVPLSTHITWLLWACIQLESTTLRIFSFFESELGQSNIEDTIVARSTRRLLAALPSNVHESKIQPEEVKSKVE